MSLHQQSSIGISNSGYTHFYRLDGTTLGDRCINRTFVICGFENKIADVKKWYMDTPEKSKVVPEEGTVYKLPPSDTHDPINLKNLYGIGPVVENVEEGGKLILKYLLWHCVDNKYTFTGLRFDTYENAQDHVNDDIMQKQDAETTTTTQKPYVRTNNSTGIPYLRKKIVIRSKYGKVGMWCD